MWKFPVFPEGSWLDEKRCRLCGARSRTISEVIGVCAECLREVPGEALRVAMEAHKRSRGMWGLPVEPPRDPKGVRCGLCDLECRIPEGGLGFCGLVANRGGRLEYLSGAPEYGVLEWYYDPLPTNCVAEWFCPGCTGRGYPRFALRRGGEFGYKNLAVFYGACNLDCLFCQNWHYHQLTARMSPRVHYKDLASRVRDDVTCICFFGGDPGPQLLHAIRVSREAMALRGNRLLRICWETNGQMNKGLLRVVTDLSLESGGIVKFDLKAWTPSIYKALTGVDPGSLYSNARYVAERAPERPEVPLFTASTLLIPGYVDVEEVRQIAAFLASIDPDIPYSLLAFHPDYLLHDLPPTSTDHALKALRAAREEGLRNVNIGNRMLLGDYYSV